MDTNSKRSRTPDSTRDTEEKRLKTEEENHEGQRDTSFKESTSTSVTVVDLLDDKSDEEGVATTENEKWQLSCRTIHERMKKLFKSHYLTDCTIVVEDNDTNSKSYQLHSFVLCMSSPVFEDMFGDDKNGKEIKINDVDHIAFEQIIEYMYTDNISLGSVEKAQSLYKVAQRFKLTSIIEKSVEVLMANMSYESIWPTLDAAVITSDSILKAGCYKYLKRHVRDLMKHQKFCALDVTVIENLVNEEVLEGVIEADLVAGVMKWAKAQCEKSNLPITVENQRRFIGGKILPKLRFLTFSQITFVKEVAATVKLEESILSREESYSVLLNLVAPGIEPLPELLCQDARLRISGKLRCTRKVFNPIGNYQNLPYTSPFGVGPYDKMIVLANPSPIASFGAKNFSCELSVNNSIELFGVQVPTFFSPQKLNDYDESYILTVQQSFNNKNIVTTTWKGKVKYNTTTELMLGETVVLEKNVKYVITLFTSNMYYVSKKLTNIETRHPVQFTFKDVVIYFGAPSSAKLATDFGFITEIIYCLKDK